MIHYPLPNSKHIKTKKQYCSKGNKGMNLENKINESNDYYNKSNIALIFKRPTPIRIVKVDYEHSLITKAFFEKQSTTDYNGLYKGYYVDFEAKATLNASLPLANIKEHQVEHLKKVVMHHGIGFFIIEESRTHEYYFFPFEHYLKFINNYSRSSIPFSYIKENGIKIKEGINPSLNYIECINQYYF